MEKTPVIGVPNGLTALQQAQGDCNEHTALFVSLARAAKIPSRIAAGIVFSDRTGPLKQFYYHAWPKYSSKILMVNPYGCQWTQHLDKFQPMQHTSNW